MTNYYVPLAAPRVPSNAMLDFRALNEAADDWNASRRQNAMLAYKQSRDAKIDARADEELSMQRKEFSRGEKEHRGRVLGSLVQSVIDAPHEQRPAMIDAWRKVDPDVDDDLRQQGLDFNSVDQWGPAIIARARGYQDPLKRREAEAGIGLKEAQAQYYGARAERGDVKAPSGYRWSTEDQLEAIPGGPATKLSSETAGRIAMMQTAREGLPDARDVFLKEWGVGGALDNVAAQIPYVGDIAWLSGDIGRARRTVRTAIEAALRAMTGAAAPESEVDRYEGMFMPGVYDNQASAKQKLDQLDQFIARAEEIVTRGRRPSPLTGNASPAGLNTPQGGAPPPANATAPAVPPSQGRTELPPVLSPEQARAMPPGTVFRTSDGRTMRVPGGP